ncbi:hypothetical protein GcM1_144011 [Golovinomyces cichoracearum]|uniref:Uncharacterized protein n=1 Tax=Golovinomyces cichoracearum TaxID=62708 RepID=A0A420JBG8_9PEZI|nr:hypothetical protein GcM1_144011 [Golovinomyces cichoracearum]
MEAARRAPNVVWQHLGSGMEGSRSQLAGIKQEMRPTWRASTTEIQLQSQSRPQTIDEHLILTTTF